MPATPVPLQGRSNATRETLAVKADEITGSVEDFLSGTLDDLGALPTASTATRETLATSTATREDLPS